MQEDANLKIAAMRAELANRRTNTVTLKLSTLFELAQLLFIAHQCTDGARFLPRLRQRMSNWTRADANRPLQMLGTSNAQPGSEGGQPRLAEGRDDDGNDANATGCCCWC